MTLSLAEAEALFGAMLDGAMPDAEIRETLVHMAERDETAPEIAGAVRAMRARQVAQTHQKLSHDLPADEAEVALEELHPLGLGARAAVQFNMRVQPSGKPAVRGTQALDDTSVVDRRIHLQAVADDAGIVQ